MAILLRFGANAANYVQRAGAYCVRTLGVRNIAAVGAAAGAAYAASQSLFPSCDTVLQACSTCFKTVLKGEYARVLFYQAKDSCITQMNDYMNCSDSSLSQQITVGVLTPCAILLAKKANQIFRDRFPALNRRLLTLKPLLALLCAVSYAAFIGKMGVNNDFEICNKLKNVISEACSANNLNYFRCSNMVDAGNYYCRWNFSARENNLEKFCGIFGKISILTAASIIVIAVPLVNQILRDIRVVPLAAAAPPIFNGQGLNLRDFEDGKRPEGWGQDPAVRNAQAQPAQEAKDGDAGEA
jgi:hypothetical protein